MPDVLTAFLLLAGSAFMVLSALGIVRMPDLFTRMSAGSKAASLGAALVVAAVAFHFKNAEIAARAVATIVFVFLTVPVAAHMVARAGYLSGVKLAATTKVDELRGHYSRETLELEGHQEET